MTHTIAIFDSRDVIRARQVGYDVAASLGFDSMDQTRIATAISEIARNVVQHAKSSGVVSIDEVSTNGRRGMTVSVVDKGRGIADVGTALQRGPPTSVLNLGAGLAGSRRLMDELQVESELGAGTKVTMVKWLRCNHDDDAAV